MLDRITTEGMGGVTTNSFWHTLSKELTETVRKQSPRDISLTLDALSKSAGPTGDRDGLSLGELKNVISNVGEQLNGRPETLRFFQCADLIMTL